MDQRTAIAKLGKIIGPRLTWRVDPQAPDAEVRAAARSRAAELGAAVKAAHDALMDRRAELLAADQRYQELRAAWQAAQEAEQRNSRHIYRCRVTVGRDVGFAFDVLAEGDNWQDVIDKLTSRGSS